jgi:prepilin-type N-terminal cleavage/methylation domain-containing protein
MPLLYVFSMHSTHLHPPTKQAFSLVELSIVLVILGLLIGGILSGQSLIRAAELRSVSTEYSRYITATQTFRDKYLALPGDMTNATEFWNAAHATPATCKATAGSGTQTCNGNGDGNVIYTANSNESYRYWQQLANAGLIEGRYDGITHGTTDYSSTAENSPKGKLGSSLWFILHYTSLSGNPYYFDGAYGNHYVFGVSRTNGAPNGSILTPEEQWNIDTKIDDGKPALGKLVVLGESGLSTCTNTVANNSATLSADYLLTTKTATCTPLSRQIF